MLTEKELRELQASYDGRLKRLFKHSDGTLWAWFNDDSLGTKLNQQQWDRYVKLCTPRHDCCNGDIIEHWVCGVFDNGLPNWFNKLFL